LLPIAAKSGGWFGAGDGLVGVGDGLVDGGDGLVGAFVTVIVIVWELSVVLTATLTWLPGAAAMLETVPLKGHAGCAENKAQKTLNVSITQNGLVCFLTMSMNTSLLESARNHCLSNCWID
jgi:hypothetical protein